MKAEIIAVGSELLTPDRLDTNSLFLTAELNGIGIEVVRKTIAGDDRDLLREVFREALGRVELIISSGGLGPTQDDLTRETVAELLGRKLKRNDAILHYIERRFRSLGREMPELNVRQAMVPEGAEILENPRGTAPGLWLEDSGHIIALLPGPPRELKPLFREQVLPRLERRVSGVRLYQREIRVTGLGESHVEQRILPIYQRYPEVTTTILAAPGETQIHLRIWTDDAAAREENARRNRARFRDRAERPHLQRRRQVARGSRGARADAEQRDDRGGGKLHRRIAGATADQHRGQLVVFSWRRGVLQQRVEDHLGRRAAGDDFGEGRGERRSCGGAGGRNSPARGQHARRGDHRRRGTRRRVGRKTRGHRARGDFARGWRQGTRRALSRASAKISAGKRRRPRWTWCACISCTTGKTAQSHRSKKA